MLYSNPKLLAQIDEVSHSTTLYSDAMAYRGGGKPGIICPNPSANHISTNFSSIMHKDPPDFTLQLTRVLISFHNPSLPPPRA